MTRARVVSGVAALVVLGAGLAGAATWQWDGGAGSGDWTAADNWNPNGTNAETNGTFASRLNVNGAQELAYSAAQGTTVYSGDGSGRGLVIGSGALGSGTMRITGGVFATAGADVIGNGSGNTGTLIVDGGIFIGGASGLSLGIGGGPTSILTVNSGTAAVAMLTLNNTTGAINLNGGVLAVSRGLIYTAGNDTLAFNGGLFQANTNLAPGAGLKMVVQSGGARIYVPSASHTLTLASAMTDGGGGGGLTNSGSGVLVLSGSNSFTGATAVNAGVVNVRNAHALGTTAGGVVVAGGARLELQGTITVAGETATLSGNGGNYFGAMQSVSGSNTWAGGITLGENDTRIGTGAASYATLVVSGVIDSGVNPYNLVVRNEWGSGTVVLSGASTYVGNTQILGGTTRLDGGDNRLPTGTKLQLGSGNVSGLFDLNGRNQEVAGLAVTQTAGTYANVITNSNPGTPGILTVNTVGGSPSTFGGVIVGNVSLAKAGSDTLTLSGDNTYTGGTTIAAGTLALSGGGTAGSGDLALAAGATFDVTGVTGGSYTLDSGQTLTGNGTVTGGLIMGSGSTLSPGFSTGTNLFSGPLTLSGNTSTFELASVTDYDQVIVAGGSLTLQSSPVLSLLVGGLTAGVGDGFTLFDNQFGGAVVLTSNFLLDGGGELADGATFTVGAHQFEIDYEGGDGNDITLTVVPEPASLGLVGAVLLAAILRRRTR